MQWVILKAQASRLKTAYYFVSDLARSYSSHVSSRLFIYSENYMPSPTETGPYDLLGTSHLNDGTLLFRVTRFQLSKFLLLAQKLSSRINASPHQSHRTDTNMASLFEPLPYQTFTPASIARLQASGYDLSIPGDIHRYEIITPYVPSPNQVPYYQPKLVPQDLEPPDTLMYIFGKVRAREIRN